MSFTRTYTNKQCVHIYFTSSFTRIFTNDLRVAVAKNKNVSSAVIFNRTISFVDNIVCCKIYDSLSCSYKTLIMFGLLTLPMVFFGILSTTFRAAGTAYAGNDSFANSRSSDKMMFVFSFITTTATT